MIVVGYLYNTNGMASWCIETAFALHEAGFDVLLVHAPNVSLPANLPYQTFSFDLFVHSSNNQRPYIIRKVLSIKNLLSSCGTGFVYEVSKHLKEYGFSVESFFLNQSNMSDHRVNVPQYICSWVYPLSFRTYVRNGFNGLESGSVKSQLLTLLNSIGFYRKDSKSFRFASKVFALTEPMYRDLVKRGIDAILLSPCCGISRDGVVVNDSPKIGPVKVIMSALNLSSRRKNLTWIMRNLNSVARIDLEITLVGNLGEEMYELVSNSPHKVEWKGLLSREELKSEYQKSDIFLFGSILDDWGYVLTEAMSSGLAVLAPNKHPFDFIVGDKRCLFRPDDSMDFISKLGVLLTYPILLQEIKLKARERASSTFSREAFISVCRENNIL